MSDDVPDPRDGPLAALQWVRRTETTAVVVARDAVSAALVVALIGILLVALSGVWPPLVAVESGSMNPHLQQGDLVFVVEEHRYGDAGHADTGVVTYRTGARTGDASFGEPGDVLVYERNGNDRTTPVIHRARFWVAAGENWYDDANRSYVDGASNCDELEYCPAPHAGFITKGDANGYYDQVRDISAPVKPSWIHGTAAVRVPWLGWVRLAATGEATLTPDVNAAT